MERGGKGHPPRRQVLGLVAALYAAFVLAWYAVDQTPLAYWWAYKLADLFNVWLYVPVPLLAFAILISRRWRASLWLAVPLLTFGLDYGDFLLPKLPPPDGAPLRVMTANVVTVNDQPASLAEAVLQQSPDVLAVQELGAPMARVLAQRLRDRYPYQALYPDPSGRGMGVLSRYPIVGDSRPEMGAGTCNCQQVTIDFDGQQITLLNAHPHSPDVKVRRLGGVPFPRGFATAETEAAVATLVRRAGTIEQPVLVVGDLNTSDRQPSYHLIRGSLGDAYREAGWGFGYTFPAERVFRLTLIPLVRIDYVLHGEGWAARAARTVDLPGSDHRGVVADLVLTPRQVQPP